MATIITNAGLAIPTGRLIGPTPTQGEPKYFGWGTGAGTAAVGNTTLFTETALDLATTSGTRSTCSTSQVTTAQTNDTFQALVTMIATGAGTVTNAGLFDASAIGTGTLYIKGDFSLPALAINDAAYFTLSIQFA